VLILSLEGCKNTEIADVMGMSPSTISTRLYRIKEQLKILTKMEFQELAGIWNNADQATGSRVEINQKLVKEVSVQKIRTQLAEVKWTTFIELVVSVLFMFFLGGYLVDQYNDMWFFLPGLLLLISTVINLGLAIYQLTLYYEINASRSVVQNQKVVARLRYLEILDTNSLYVIIPLFFAPFLIVFSKAFLEYDMYAHSSWMLYNTAGSIVVAMIIVFLLKKYPNKGLKESLSFLNELKESEQ
jgi:predicted transcriptional regulator